jgi:Conserved protein/domain typically associated with flavoprotein oxygenases, DIM6/NTAB family
MSLKKINIEELQFNPFTAINKQWMLITAGDETKHNTMTASWGSLGELWRHYVSTIHIRPQRYTLDFVESQEYYSLCFFDESHRGTLNFCGTKSGRDFDKGKECNLTPLFDENAPYYKEAELVFICRKLYKQEMTAESFIDKSIIDSCYPLADFHHTYIGEIVSVLKK